MPRADRATALRRVAPVGSRPSPASPAASPNGTRALTVVAKLRERILNGAFAPGQHLREERLAATFGVSRTPVRDALNALSREGFLVYFPNRGYFVKNFKREDILAAYEVRAELEGLACRLVALKGIGEAAEAALRGCLATGDRILRRKRLLARDLAPYRQMNVTFHETILDLSGNKWLVSFVHQTCHIPYASHRLILWADYDIILRSHDDHHRILHAIVERNPVRVEGLMREHILFAGKVLRGRLESLD